VDLWTVVGEPSSGGAVSLLTTALLLGIRHGIDWDHIAAITDITSTTAAADAGERAHEAEHARGAHAHAHGGAGELAAHRTPDAVGSSAAGPAIPPPTLEQLGVEQKRALVLGTLYALGHGLVVAGLGLIALLFGAILPDWVDPIMSKVVGVTLIVLGVWVFYSIYAYVRHGTEFRLRSRWMLIFAWIRAGWRWFRARLHGHEHAQPVEMSSYGPRTAFGVGMIHGIGAETGTQVLIIAAIGGAAGAGLGVPMMIAFIAGLLISNSVIVVLTSTGFVASQLRSQLYLVAGVIAGAFSLVVGALFLFELEGSLPNLEQIFGFIGPAE
jgi:high-affinity nickel-transport protein